MNRTRISLVLASVAVLVAASPAPAASLTDPNDVSGKLDLRSLTVTRTASGLATVTVRTWDSWAKATLPASGSPNRLFVLFDIDSDAGWEYRARIQLLGGALVALVSGQGQQFEPISVTRPSTTRARFTFPLDVFGAADFDLQAAARSVYRGGLCSATCIDRAPDAGWLDVPVR